MFCYRWFVRARSHTGTPHTVGVNDEGALISLRSRFAYSKNCPKLESKVDTCDRDMGVMVWCSSCARCHHGCEHDTSCVWFVRMPNMQGDSINLDRTPMNISLS